MANFSCAASWCDWAHTGCKLCVWKWDFCQVSFSKWNLSLNTSLKMPLPLPHFLLCDVFSLENTFLCSDSPVGILLIAAVAAGVSVMRNSETLNEQSLLSLLQCVEGELRVLCFQTRSFLRFHHHLQLSQDFLFHVHQQSASRDQGCEHSLSWATWLHKSVVRH